MAETVDRQFSKIIQKARSNPLLLAILSGYLFLCLWNITSPGVHYDEVLFGNAALGGIGGSTFILKRIGAIPVLLMPYIGALKAYIYYPIFHYLGTSVFVIRIPMIIVTALSLFLLYKSIHQFFDKNTALLATALTAFNATFIGLTRTDIGPSVIEFFLKTVILFCFALWIKTKRHVLLPVIAASLLLGTFNKLNFIWFVNAFAFSALVIYWKDVLLAIKKFGGLLMVSLSAGGLLTTYGLYVYITLRFSIGDILKAAYDFPAIIKNLAYLIIGVGYTDIILATVNVPLAILLGVPFIFLLGIFAVLGIKNIKQVNIRDQRYRSLFFFIILTAVSFAEILVTPQAKAIWHMLTLLPMLSVLLACVLLFVWQNMKNSVIRTLLFATITLSIIVSNSMMHYYLTQEPRLGVFSQSIYSLMSYTKSHQNNFVSMDWGIHTQLLLNDPIAGKYSENFWELTSNTDQSEILALVEKGYLPHKDKFRFINTRVIESDPAQQRVVSALNSFGYELTLDTIISSHNVNYYIYKITPLK